MASIQVTPPVGEEMLNFLDKATHALDVTINLSGFGFNMYVFVNGGFLGAGREYKILKGQQLTFSLVKDDIVQVQAMGAGVVEVTTT